MSAQLISPTEHDEKIAKENLVRFPKDFLKSNVVKVIVIDEEGQQEEPIIIPTSAFELLKSIVEHMSNGNPITLTPYHAVLTTQEAANFLNVSRPYLIKLLEEGTIPFSKVGKHRRIQFLALKDYKQKQAALQKEAFDKMNAIADEFGMDD